MSGKRSLIRTLALILGVFLLGCAEPRYLQKIQLSPSDNDPQKVSTCSIPFKHSLHCLTWEWEKMPTSREYGSLVLKIYRLNNHDQTPVLENPAGELQVVLWMPSMGHGSTPTQTEQLDVGTYRVRNVFFIMPGDWDMHFQIQDGATTIDEAKVSLIF